MSEIDEDEDVGFVQRHAGLIFLGIILIVSPAIFFAARKMMGQHQSSSRQEEVMVRLPPPPPPPKPRATPTPEQQPTPEQEQKMVEQPQEQDVKRPDPPKAAAPAPLGTSITGPGGGPDFGLGSGLGGGGGYGGGGGGNGSKYGWYASELQKRVLDVLRNNPRTRRATMNVVVRIWPDSTGRVTKVHVSGSTGDPALDASLQNDILAGMQLDEAPPADMPMPIVIRLSARRPN